MTATATCHECVRNTLHTATMHASVDEPQPSTAGNTRQVEVAVNGAGLNRVSRGSQFLMNLLLALSACHA